MDEETDDLRRDRAHHFVDKQQHSAWKQISFKQDTVF